MIEVTQIDLPSAEQQKLAQLALAAEFDKVETYVAEHLLALAQQHEIGLAPMTDEELAASLAMCDQGMSEADAGQGLTVDQALRLSLGDLENAKQ